MKSLVLEAFIMKRVACFVVCMLLSIILTSPAVSEQWTESAEMLTGRTNFGTVLIDGKIYVFGGKSAGGELSETIESYDLATKKWTKIGAVVGGIWGLLALPITLLCIIFVPSIPDSVGMILFYIGYLPFSLIAKMITVPSSMAFVVGINFIGWVLIGATIGYLYGLILGDKR